MSAYQAFDQLPPTIAIHLLSAGTALLLGPLALTLPKGTPGHRSLGYAWVLAMLAAAVSSAFIRDFRLPNLAGYTPIHLLTLATFVGVGLGLWHIAHRRVMGITYGALLLAGVMSLLPQRFLGGFVWASASGLI